MYFVCSLHPSMYFSDWIWKKSQATFLIVKLQFSDESLNVLRSFFIWSRFFSFHVIMFSFKWICFVNVICKQIAEHEKGCLGIWKEKKSNMFLIMNVLDSEGWKTFGHIASKRARYLSVLGIQVENINPEYNLSKLWHQSSRQPTRPVM